MTGAAEQDTTMKALTIWQPWAYCIVTGDKPVENRSWSTTYRGPLAIHAGRQWDKYGACDPRVVKVFRPFMFQPEAQSGEVWQTEHYDRLTFGAVIGTADLVDCHRANSCCAPWGDPDLDEQPTWHWVLRAVRLLPKPMSVRGRQRLWNIHTPLVRS